MIWGSLLCDWFPVKGDCVGDAHAMEVSTPVQEKHLMARCC